MGLWHTCLVRYPRSYGLGRAIMLGSSGCALEYDTGADAWLELAPCPTECESAAVAELEGRVVAIGSGGHGHALGSVAEAYDPHEGSWQHLRKLRARASVSRKVVGSLWTFGGLQDEKFLAESERYDAAPSQTQRPIQPNRRSSGAFDLSTRASLVSGVPSSYPISGAPSTLVLFSQNAVSLAVDDKGRTVAAAATYDSGKVCFFSHGDYISKEKSKLSFGLVTNCVGWMKTGKSSLVCSLNGLDTPTQRDAVKAAGCTSTTSGGLTQSALSGVDVLFLNSEDLDDNGAHTSQNIEAVRSFVRSGGPLVVSGLGWYWTTYRNPVLSTHPATALLAPCGLAITADVASLSNGATVQQNIGFSEDKTNLWFGLDTVKTAGTGTAATTLAFASLKKCFASGLDDDLLASLRKEGASAFSAACSSLQWGVTTENNKAKKTDQQRRSCMNFAWGLPASVQTVDWAAESALFPGDVPGASQVTKTVTVPRDRTRWYSTALFVSAASDLTVKIPASEIGNLVLQVGCHTDSIYDSEDWSRWREIAVSVPLNAAETTVKVKFAGLLYIDVAKKGSPVEVQFSGKLSDAPVYRAGTTTADQWNAAVSSTASPWGELEVKDVVFSLPTSALKKVKDMAPVADYWQRVMDCIYHFRAIDPVAFKQRYVTDGQISLGYMHSGYPIMMWLDVVDTTLMTTGTWSHWGQYHECGHNMQSPMWTFDGTVEVTNNMWSLYCERKMTGKWEWQKGNINDARTKAETYKKAPDFKTWKNDPWLALLMYIDIDDDKRDQWLVRTSKRVNHNLCPLFDTWGVPISDSARQQVASLPAYDSPETLTLGRVSLKTFFDTYVSAQQDGTILADRTAVKAWEVFTIENSPTKSGAVVFKSAHGKYLSANPDTHKVTCDRDTASDWETFFPESKGSGQWAFKATFGKYLQTTDTPHVLAVWNTEAAGWESFTVSPAAWGMTRYMVLLGPLSWLLRAFDLSTRASLVSGVPSKIKIDGSPSTLVLFAQNAVSLAVDDDGRSVAAAATYDSGKVCFFSHGDYISKEKSKLSFGLVTNCVGWMKTGKSSLVCSLNDLDTPTQRDAVKAAGCTSTTSGGLTQSALSGVDVLFLNSEDLDDNGAHTSQNIEAVRSFVRNGGSLVVSGLGWYWTTYRNPVLSTHPANLLLSPCGLAITDDVASLSNGATVQQNTGFSEDRTNLWFAFDTIKTAGTGTASTTLAFVGSQLTSLKKCFTSGLDDDRLSSLRKEASSAFSAACSSLQWGITTENNQAKKTDQQRRNCMDFAWGLPASVQTVDWAAESALFPGDVPGASQVTKTVTVPRDRTRWYSTALFVSAASDLNVKIPASEIGNLVLQVGCHTDSIYDSEDWSRWREIAVSVPLNAAETTVKVKFAGLLYIDVAKKGSPVDVQFSGKLSDAPVYRAGTTTADQWNAAVSSTASPWGELEVKDVVFSLPTSALKKVKDMASVGDYWQRVMDCMYHFRTTDPEAFKQRYVTDVQISLGYMHSGYPIMMWLDVVDTTLMTTGTSHWGQYHECGHNMQSDMWTFDGTVEVTNNLFSLYCERQMTGNWDWATDSLNEAKTKGEAYKKNPDFNTWKNEPFMALLMYIEIGERWGWDVFMDLFREYDALPQNERPVSDDDKRDQWLVRTSKRVNHNLCPLFDTWAVPISDSARQQVASLPAYNSADTLLQGRVSLKSYFNTYVSAQPNGDIEVDRTAVQSWEVFTIESSPVVSGAIVFKSTHGKYLSANPDTHEVVCDRDNADDWESFFPESKGSGQWVFKATNGRYLQTTDSPHVLAASNTDAAGWETFTVYPVTGMVDDETQSSARTAFISASAVFVAISAAVL
eukprot:m51a1_g2814 hypothetical protein (1838) ;mRNA; f:145607-155070